ncbi:hypothetical protein TSOC_002143 [Tetrabaena socialis]|uniref:SnoaL-like domain-containing protein n=1 Tax=Tetrabaena socialis TaxID=47790 RepID=A0A2J8AEZ3_9CHLO|nr:hypothetical protein TSOC_002143 [Tetrabaena socialis]|eukprot:PNH11080.1 hypothetical protein TSOC_002143 [Tetrabaena socialis]
MATLRLLRRCTPLHTPGSFAAPRPVVAAPWLLPQRGSRAVFCKAAMAQEAAAIVQKQLELYNAREVAPFMELFTDDVHVSDGISGAVIATSKEALTPRYVERFKGPVHCELLGRLVLGNVVVDREIITGLPDNGVADCMATYVCDTAAGKISKITFVWYPRTDGVKL